MADAVESSKHSEILNLLSEFLLSAEVTNAYTLDEFKEAFPVQYREHNDVKLLYKAFQSKRKKIRAMTKRNIALHCAAISRLSNSKSKNELMFSNSDSEDSHEKDKNSKEDDLKEKLSSMKNDLKTVEKQFTRCAKLLKQKELLKHLNEKDFDLSTIQNLEERIEKSKP